jgi:hypothetical protein
MLVDVSLLAGQVSLKDFTKHVVLGMDSQRGYDSDGDNYTDGE